MRLTVNGTSYELEPAGHETLLSVLRERLTLTGAKLVCGRGECGACTVLLAEPGDGAPSAVYACLTLAAGCDGSSVTTVEGLGRPGALHPIQEAFVEHAALQCGFCTPGMVLSAKALLDETPCPTRAEIRDYLGGNLCRCTGYWNIIEAVEHAARAMAGTTPTDAAADAR
jgi:carbon-monoxide dehydrogenase small subunit